MQEQWGTDLEIVIKVLQISLAPAFLLAAVASLLNVLTSRFARTVDRSRELQKLFPSLEYTDRIKTLIELRAIAKRKKLVRISILFSILAAVVICLMVVLLFLMGLTSFSKAEIVIGMFAVSMVLIACSLCALLIETGFASHEVDVPLAQLEQMLDSASASD
jgi:hypothetical protein